MARPMIVHQLNAVGVTPVEFIEIAGQNGCDLVTLFTFNGEGVLPRTNTGLTYPTDVTPEMKADVLAALSANGVAVDGIEFFPLTADVDLELFRPALALGAELGARRASSHIFVQDDALVVDKLGALCDLAAEYGMKVSSEFCPLTPGNPSLERGKWLVDQVGSDRFGIGADTLHVIRSGSGAAELAETDARYFGIAQINDAFGTQASSDYISDVHNREVPGKGDLPLHDLLNALPAALAIEIEVPAAHRRAAGVSAADHVRDVVAGTRAVLAELKPSR